MQHEREEESPETPRLGPPAHRRDLEERGETLSAQMRPSPPGMTASSSSGLCQQGQPTTDPADRRPRGPSLTGQPAWDPNLDCLCRLSRRLLLSCSASSAATGRLLRSLHCPHSQPWTRGPQLGSDITPPGPGTRDPRGTDLHSYPEHPACCQGCGEVSLDSSPPRSPPPLPEPRDGDVSVPQTPSRSKCANFPGSPAPSPALPSPHDLPSYTGSSAPWTAPLSLPSLSPEG
ncbi:anther-specific proline-rich protein APG-like [Tupaia chinensis]|uniref:anther-specific proline-rich protein APG-like n=1 Tax=Tupaia chinensis TaxID=246437 RepID=UPI000FFBA13C|nr:anther-specific proline-rich protein APG-like [Tupaia chinensis]